MKYRSVSVSAITAFLVFILFSAYGQNQAEWQGTIEEVDGVTIVKNPKEPIYGGDIYLIEEELTIREKTRQRRIFIFTYA